MDTDLMTQVLQYLLGVIPGDIAGNVLAVVTTIVTLCTLIIRFWKEPSTKGIWHTVWKILHVMACFKTPSISK